MENDITLSEDNPKKNRNIFSRVLFTWMYKYFYIGGTRGINIHDMFKPLNEDTSKILGDKIEKNWESELRKSKDNGKEPSLTKAISDTFLLMYLIYGMLLFVQHVCLKAFLPHILGYLLQLFNGMKQVDDPELEKYICGTILIAAMALIIFFYHHTGYGQQKIGMRVRIALSTLVFRKMTRLSRKSLNDVSSGELVNLLSNDVQRFDNVATALHSVWIAPFQIAVVTFYLWDKIGVVCLAGVLSMVTLTLLQSTLGRTSSNIRAKVATKTDYRVRLMSEIISGIQVIKMYAWEKPFEKLVHAARLDEVKSIKAANYIRAIFLSSMVFIERTTLYFTVVAFVLTDNVLSSDMVFMVAQFLNVLQSAVAVLLPMAIQSGAEALVSIRRIKHFLLLEERITEDIQAKISGIEIKDVTASYDQNEVLKDITLSIPEGSLCIIVGPVGSGKSSILQLLLQELSAKKGQVSINGRISYSSQQPWIFNSSVRSNILFGREYDESRYRSIVEVSALVTDFQQFRQSDSTVVSEKGHSLSGGQKARINLARAIYNEADIYLLDDPLSAVDTHVANHIFNECILGYLRNKTRVLVTHQTQFLNKADMVVVIKDGKIEITGTSREIQDSNLEFTKALLQHQSSYTKPNDSESSKEAEQTDNKMTQTILHESKMADKNLHYNKNVGMEYVKSAGNIIWLTVLFASLLATQLACSGTDYWISYWTDQEETDHRPANTPFTELPDIEEHIDTHYAISIYSGLVVAIILLTVLRSYLFFNCASKASKQLHSKIFNSLIKVPMNFFDANNSGRILNRFSKDTGAMDEMLPKVLSEAIQVILVMVGSLALIILANYWMAITVVVLCIIFIGVRKWFLSTAKSIKHVESIAKSPVFSQISSTLNGITTIRAFKSEENMINQFDQYQDVHTSAWFLLLSCMASFGLWLDLLCILFLACIVYSFVLISENTDVSGAMVGLAISQAIGLTGMIQYGMMQIAEVVNQFTSVERILQYTILDQEGPFETSNDNLPKSWPNDGGVMFENASLKYNEEDEAVLKNLTFNIKPGEKVGIVGRTGAGKSSLISALFRLVPIDGTISIDELNISKLGLHDVRSKISIIPQEPILFSETMRYNLDPFQEYNDSDIWTALTEVELKNLVPSLDYQIKEGGINFSIGQRQLICLARALIRRNKILVLDEATANVDHQTDNLIQKTIRNKFNSCTVLTVAHRLNTVMDSDKILVMDSGSIVEFDHPHVLLQNIDGHFTSMVNEMGSKTALALREVAKNKYMDSQRENL